MIAHQFCSLCQCSCCYKSTQSYYGPRGFEKFEKLSNKNVFHRDLLWCKSLIESPTIKNVSSTTGFIIQIETATGTYQKGQYSKAFTKSGSTLKSSQKWLSQQIVNSFFLCFFPTVLQHLHQKYKSAKVRKAPVIFQKLLHTNTLLCHYIESG